MTLTEPTFLTPFAAVVDDLYRDIHKGIRTQLFDLTSGAGRIDPSDREARVAIAADLDRVVNVLVMHAAHEDDVVQPGIAKHLPALAENIEVAHATLEARMDALRALAAESVDAPRSGQRHTAHRVYVELASFTSAYLAHQDVEERLVMPALEAAIGVDAVFAMHQAIVGSIPPAQMAESLAFMLPAMNIDDRAELLGGMRAGAPAEVFAGVWGLAGSVLTPADYKALATRLDVAS